jgi:hypothetical protein
MNDPYFKAIQEQWPNIRALYMTFESEKPIILYAIEDKKIYAYPYEEFKAEMSKVPSLIGTRLQVGIRTWEHGCLCEGQYRTEIGLLYHEH